jgi:hypothetical protein
MFTAVSAMRTQTLDAWGWIFAIFGAVTLGNAVWMLAGPLHWYHELPARVPDTGPFNPHFVRDIGAAFLAVGVALVWAALAPRWRPPLVVVAALFLGGHALVHVYDTVSGALGHAHWSIDAPGVYLPAAVICYAAVIHRTRSEPGGP